jgi:hypothetical protein
MIRRIQTDDVVHGSTAKNGTTCTTLARSNLQDSHGRVPASFSRAIRPERANSMHAIGRALHCWLCCLRQGPLRRVEVVESGQVQFDGRPWEQVLQAVEDLRRLRKIALPDRCAWIGPPPPAGGRATGPDR